jgi:cytochrome c-type biogenesis protein CcmH/NrfG
VNQGTPLTPDPDPQRPTLASLEARLRALPPAEVPAALSSKLIATIPPTKAAAATTSGLVKYWPWVAAITVICIAASAVIYFGQSFWTAKLEPGTKQNPTAVVPSNTDKNPPLASKAIGQFEDAVRIDPYNVDAWFNLAKAQADAHRADDAISSAQKALDIARSTNRADLARTIEAWLRTHGNAAPTKPGR